MHNRIALAPSKAALLWRFPCLHFIFLCTEFVVLSQGCAEPAWQRVEGACQCPLMGEPKIAYGQQNNHVGERMHISGHMHMVMSA